MAAPAADTDTDIQYTPAATRELTAGHGIFYLLGLRHGPVATSHLSVESRAETQPPHHREITKIPIPIHSATDRGHFDIISVITAALPTMTTTTTTMMATTEAANGTSAHP